MLMCYFRYTISLIIISTYVGKCIDIIWKIIFYKTSLTLPYLTRKTLTAWPSQRTLTKCPSPALYPSGPSPGLLAFPYHHSARRVLSIPWHLGQTSELNKFPTINSRLYPLIDDAYSLNLFVSHYCFKRVFFALTLKCTWSLSVRFGAHILSLTLDPRNP